MLWATIWPELGLPVKSLSLPRSTQCAICKAANNSSIIFPDPVFGGQWHSCSSCGFSGDTIELAQAVWGLNLTATMTKIRSISPTVPDDLDLDHYEKVRDNRKAIAKLAVDGMAAARNPSQAFQRLLEYGRLRWSNIPEQRRADAAKVFGISDSRTINRAFRPHAVSHTGLLDGVRKIFPGSRWDETIFIPLREVPGRVDGMWFGGRRLEVADRTHEFFDQRSQGIGYHADLAYPEQLIGVRNPMHYLRLQFRSLRLDSFPPNYVLHGLGDKLDTGWAIFPNAEVLFWEHILNARAFYRAIKRDAKITMAGPRVKTESEVSNWIGEHSPGDIAALLNRGARHWTDVMSKYIAESSDREVEQMLLELRSLGEPLLDVADKLDRKAKEKALRLVPENKSIKYTAAGHCNVIEQGGGWWAVTWRGQAMPICDYIIRVEKIITYKTGEITYVGYVLYRNEKVPFAAHGKVFEKDPSAFIQDLLVRNQKGFGHCNPQWKSKLLPIAASFHEPEFVAGLDKVGWNQETGQLSLPRHTYGLAGTSMGEANWYPHLPAAVIPPPASVSLDKLEKLSEDTAANRALWNLATHVLATVLGPGVGQEAPGVLLTGSGTLRVMPACLEALGVQRSQIQNMTNLGRLWDLEEQHDWPRLVMSNLSMHMYLVKDWIDQHPGKCRAFVLSQDSMAVPLCLDEGWRHIEINNGRLTSTAYVADALSAYIDDWVKRMLAGEVQPTGDWYEWVRSDLIAWAKTLGVDLEAARMGRENVDSPDEALLYWTRYIHKALGSGDVQMARPEMAGDRTAIRVEQDGLWFPENWQTLFRRLPNQKLKPSNLGWHLESAGALVERTSRQDKPGFLVSYKWWRAQSDRSAPNLKIVG